jgi:hypothetical protein
MTQPGLTPTGRFNSRFGDPGSNPGESIVERRLRFPDLVALGLFNNRPQLSKAIKDYGFPRGQLTTPNCRTWGEDSEVKPWIASRPTAPKRVPKSPGRPRKAAEVLYMTSTYGAGPDPAVTGIEAQKSVDVGKHDGKSHSTLSQPSNTNNRRRRPRPIEIPMVDQIGLNRWRVTWPGAAPFECSDGALTAMVRDLSPSEQSALFRQLTLKRGRA